MQGVQCDNCRKFSATATNWLILSHQSSNGFSLFGQPVNELNGTFCSMLCLAEWAYVKAVLESEAKAVEAAPKPRPRQRKKPDVQG